MKIIVIGDIHASGFSDDAMIDDYPKRLFFIKQSLEYIIQYGKQHGINYFMIVGDIYNDKTIIYNEAQNMLTDILKSNEDCFFAMFSGNHDLSSTGSNQKSAIAVFSKFPNVYTYLYEPSVNTIFNGVIVPFTNSFLEKMKSEKLKAEIERYQPKILYAHVGLNEAVLQSGLSKVDKLRISDISQFPLAILGHYHKPQDLVGGHTRVYYVGSLIPKDWNDKNEEKRFLVVDTETLEVEAIPLNVPGVSRFYEFVIKDDTTDDERKSFIEQAAKLKSEGHHVRIVNKSQVKVQKDESISDMIILENNQVDITDRGISITQTKMEQVEKYLDIKKIEEKELYLKVLKDKNLLELGVEE